MNGSKLYLYSDNLENQCLKAIKNNSIPVTTDFDFISIFLNFDQWWLGETAPISEADIKKEQQSQYDALPENVRNFLPFSVFEQQQGKVLESIQKSVKAKKAASLVSGYATRVHAKMAMLRLLSTSVSHHAWSQWANQYSGICVVVNSQSDLFQSTAQSPRQFGPVTYGGHHHPAPSKQSPFPELLLDHQDYANLSEWRLVFPKSSCKEVQTNLQLPISSSAISGIYWSVNTPERVIEDIRTMKAQDMRFRQIEVGCVKPSKDQWKLVL